MGIVSPEGHIPPQRGSELALETLRIGSGESSETGDAGHDVLLFVFAGVGTLLLAHAERVARQLGVGELRLFTNSLMTSNIALYQRNGYRITEVEPRAAGWAVVHMAKPVTLP